MSQALLEELAHAVAAKLAETASVDAVVDLAAQRVRVTDGEAQFEVFLGNAYEEYVHAAPEVRAEIVARYAMVGDRRELAAPTAEDWQRVLPKLVPRRERELLRLRFGDVQNLAPGVAIAAGLALELALDLPDSIRTISPSDIASAGLSEAQAYERARRNLLARSREAWQPVGPGLWQSPWADYFDGARLALPTLFPRIGMKGDPIVTVPNRRALLATGSREPEGLRQLYAATRALAGEERPLHLGALRLVDGAWRALGDADVDLLAFAPSLLLLSSLQDALDAQVIGAELRPVIEAAGYHVEPLFAVDHEGVLMTVTKLPRTPRLVVPRADMVLCDGKMFAWGRLADMLGRNLVPLDVWPMHYEVRRAPTLVEVAATLQRR